MTSISNQTELINWATDGNNVGTLTSDITLSGGTWPLSLNNNKTLDGDGYTITIHSGMVDGIFKLNTNGYNATVQNLIVDADAITTFSTAAGILFAQTDSDNLSITATNCGCIGSFQYGSSGGFIVGNMTNSSNGDLLITKCFSTGTIYGDYSGGIVGVGHVEVLVQLKSIIVFQQV